MNVAVKQLPSHEGSDRPTRGDVEAAVRTIIAWTGDDPKREGLQDTPARVAKILEELYAGYGQHLSEIFERQFKEVDDFRHMVLLRDIPFYSNCQHHMLPFRGKAHIAYYPTKVIIAPSKLVSVVDIFARRLQTQENLTVQIGKALEDSLDQRGAAVMIEAEHMCMSMRGVSKSGSSTITSYLAGIFREDPAEREKFFRAVGDCTNIGINSMQYS